ncbi:MAG: hypothetical protein P4L84_23750 [Isosphaeraceae bacterium]|nr:hypothetical protein [Isosphaeraceae bacterium]
MRSLARLSPALFGLALALPAVCLADSYGPTTAAPEKHHRGLFRTCMCVDCQRARVKAKDGVDVPAPPPVPSNIVSVGDSRSMPVEVSKRAMMGTKNQDCVACREGTIVGAPVMMADGNAPGRAVVGGVAPGYAVVGGAYPLTEPAPIGTVRGPASNKTKNAVAGRRGKKDDSVATTQFSSPTPVPGTTHNPPHVIRHLFGLDAIGRHTAEELERRHREKHASIAYGPQKAEPVVDLPASVVYKQSR